MDIRMVKPISYIKAHAAKVLDELGRDGQPVGITQHGEIKAVLVAADEYQRTQETLAFLKLVALGDDNEGIALVKAEQFEEKLSMAMSVLSKDIKE